MQKVPEDDPRDDQQKINDFVVRVRNGDLGAFEAIVRRYERHLRAWLATHSQPGIDVDEIAQRTFVAAYSGIHQYQPNTNFSSWLFTIARYQLQTEVTRLRRLADYHSRFAPALMQQYVILPDDEPLSLWELRLEHMRECLNQLGEGLRQYIRWRYEEQISIEQMSVASGRSASAVKKQLWLLRQKLLRCIQERMSESHG